MDEYPEYLAPMARAKIVELLCEQAQNNPYAQRLGEKVTAEQVLRTRVTSCIRVILLSCVYTEGACALIFASAEMARKIKERNGREPIWLTGVGAANEPYFVGNDITRYKVLHRIYSDHVATKKALSMAGITINYVQVIELHDAFIPQSMITLAEMGVVPLGKANDLVEEGIIMNESSRQNPIPAWSGRLCNSRNSTGIRAACRNPRVPSS